MTAILYYSRNPNPRLAVAVARYLEASVKLEWAAPFHPKQAAYFKALNPTQRIPILLEGDQPLWEADAIACRLSQMVGSDFWRMGAGMPDMIRWISWGKENFVRACDMVQFELGTKRRYGIGPLDTAKLAEGRAGVSEAAAVLDAHLAGRDWLLGADISYADFRMATFMPFNDVMGLSFDAYPALSAWAARLDSLPAWAAPFEGLDAPALPPVA